MTQRYTRLQSTQKVELVGEHTFNGSAQNVKVVSLEDTPFAHGFHCIALIIQNADLTGDVTVKANINPAADGSGTDVTIATMTLPTADANLVLEVVPEEVSYFADKQATPITVKSIVFELTGTNTDTADVAVIGIPMQKQQSLTPTDVTTVS